MSIFWKVAKGLAAFAGNFLLSNVALFIGVGIVYGATVRLTGLHGEPYELISAVPVYAVAGILMAMWTRSLLLVIVPTWAGFFYALSAFKWVIYYADMRGNPTLPEDHYLFRASGQEVGFSILVTAATVLGWWIVRFAAAHWAEHRASKSQAGPPSVHPPMPA